MRCGCCVACIPQLPCFLHLLLFLPGPQYVIMPEHLHAFIRHCKCSIMGHQQTLNIHLRCPGGDRECCACCGHRQRVCAPGGWTVCSRRLHTCRLRCQTAASPWHVSAASVHAITLHKTSDLLMLWGFGWGRSPPDPTRTRRTRGAHIASLNLAPRESGSLTACCKV